MKNIELENLACQMQEARIIAEHLAERIKSEESEAERRFLKKHFLYWGRKWEALEAAIKLEVKGGDKSES